MYISVGELKEILEDVDDDRVVILQRDAEGNGYSPLDGGDDNCMYTPEFTWSGEISLEKLTDELRERGFSDLDVVEEGENGSVKAFVLYPIN